ncbi:zinc-ribbon domain-containing protein [Paenibacillus sp. CMAA1364]
MSHLFNKMKQSVSDVGKKAQTTVEAATLKMQLISKEKDLDKNYTAIGRIIHQSIARKEKMIPTADIQKYEQNILTLEKELQQMQRKIQHLQSLKECGCGKMLPSDATYCPFCGQQFHTLKVKQVSVDKHNSHTTNHCSQCGTAVISSDRFCSACGHHLNMS